MIDEILDKIQLIQGQLREGKIEPALDDLNILEEELLEILDKKKMSAEAEDANAGVIRGKNGEVIGEEYS